jgi:hypothetical protein
MNEFKREERYIVTKIKSGKKVECVVVESDWPEYEIVWKMIQDRMEGKPNIIEQQAETALADVEELKAELESETKVANSLRMVCKRNNELLKEIAELQEKLKEEDKEWRNAFEVSEHDKDILNARWGYIKTDIEGARALLILLRDGKGTPDDFDTMVDRIIESRKVAGL